MTPRRTVSSFESTDPRSTSVQDERVEEGNEDDGEDELQEATSASSSTRSSVKASRTQLGKKRLHPVEDKILRALEKCENRNEAREKVEHDDDRHFLLSLLKSLSSLPSHLKTSCKIEIMQCINKYENISRQQHQNQTSFTYVPTTQSYSGHQQNDNFQQPYQSQPQSYHFKPMHHPQMYIPNQQPSASPYSQSQLQSESQYPPRTFATSIPTPSPIESASSYISNFTEETDSELSNR